MKFPNSRRDGILDCHFEVRSHLRIEFKIERLFVRMGAPLFFSTIANRLVDSLIETRCQSFSSSECVVGDPQTILKMHSPRAGSIARGRWCARRPVVSAERRLQDLGIQLPAAPTPFGTYCKCSTAPRVWVQTLV